MSAADHYRKIATDLKVRASYEKEADLALRWEGLARSYLRLAEEAEGKNLVAQQLEPSSKSCLDDEVSHKSTVEGAPSSEWSGS